MKSLAFNGSETQKKVKPRSILQKETIPN